MAPGEGAGAVTGPGFEVTLPDEAYFSGCPLTGSCFRAALTRSAGSGEVIGNDLRTGSELGISAVSERTAVSCPAGRGRSTSIREERRSGCVRVRATRPTAWTGEPRQMNSDGGPCPPDSERVRLLPSRTGAAGRREQDGGTTRGRTWEARERNGGSTPASRSSGATRSPGQQSGRTATKCATGPPQCTTRRKPRETATSEKDGKRGGTEDPHPAQGLRP